MNYCLKGRELLQGLKRSEWLPPFDDEALRIMLTELDEIVARMDATAASYDHGNFPEPVKVSINYFHQCLNRNQRYIDSYLHNRLVKIRNLRWETGPVLPVSLRHDTLSAREKEYFAQYNNLLTEYIDSIDLDLTVDLEPPKDLYIEVRVLLSCGKIMTESGPVSLDKGSIHFLKRSDVEQFIREGKVEHVLQDGQC